MTYSSVKDRRGRFPFPPPPSLSRPLPLPINQPLDGEHCRTLRPSGLISNPTPPPKLEPTALARTARAGGCEPGASRFEVQWPLVGRLCRAERGVPSSRGPVNCASGATRYLFFSCMWLPYIIGTRYWFPFFFWSHLLIFCRLIFREFFYCCAYSDLLTRSACGGAPSGYTTQPSPPFYL